MVLGRQQHRGTKRYELAPPERVQHFSRAQHEQLELVQRWCAKAAPLELSPAAEEPPWPHDAAQHSQQQLLEHA